MVHAIRIKNGQIYYCNRYLQTPRYKVEKAAGEPIFMRIGELGSNRYGLAKSLINGLLQKVGYKPGCDISFYENGTANTAFTLHQKKTYALYEQNFPFQIKVDKNEKNFDI